MVELYVAGRMAGTLADSDRILREAAANYQPVEYREPDGRVLGTFTPVPFDEPYYLRDRSGGLGEARG
jgi:hypothetical protein